MTTTTTIHPIPSNFTDITRLCVLTFVLVVSMYVCGLRIVANTGDDNDFINCKFDNIEQNGHMGVSVEM